jgi:uncharacterized membrane protein YeiH
MLYILDLFGVFVFAISGALVAGRKQMDLLGVLVTAGVTAIGGGTLRDLLLGRSPVFWVGDPIYVVVIAGAALGTVIYTRYFRVPQYSLLLADTFGLAFFAISGARLAAEMGVSNLIVVMMGTMTGVAGGMIRDILAARVPLILRKDIYATAAIMGCTIYLLLEEAGLNLAAAGIISMAVIFAIRLTAIVRGLGLPRYRLDPDHD